MAVHGILSGMKRLIVPLLVLVVLGLLAASAAVAYYYSQTLPVNSQTTTKANFVIPPGQAVLTIAKRLEEAGVIRNAQVFRLELKRLGLESKLQAGSFQVSPSLSMREVATILTTGTNDQWITLPEGWRREEIASYLTAQELPGFNEADFLASTATLEGKLFPETYLVPNQITTTSLGNLLTRTFEKKVVTNNRGQLTIRFGSCGQAAG